MNKQTIITAIGIIVILALISLGLYYSQNITTKTNNLLPVANNALDNSQQIGDIEDQINDLINQLNQLKNEDITNEYSTYTNNKYGFSFNYLSDYIVEETNSSLSESQIVLKEKSGLDNSGMTIFINPDGFGPIWYNIKYDLNYSNGKISVIDKITQKCDFCDENNSDTIIADVEVEGVKYFFTFWYLQSGNSKEQIFKDIITSFKFFS